MNNVGGEKGPDGYADVMRNMLAQHMVTLVTKRRSQKMSHNCSLILFENELQNFKNIFMRIDIRIIA